MTNTKTIAKKQHKHLKRKERFNHYLDLGTPQVSVDKHKPQQKHELLKDWLDAS